MVSGLRRKYKIIMIIMSHFTRNNTVGAGIRRGRRAIRRANNVGRRGSAISRCSADPRSFLRPHTLLFLLPSLLFAVHLHLTALLSFIPAFVFDLHILYVLYFSMRVCKVPSISISHRLLMKKSLSIRRSEIPCQVH